MNRRDDSTLILTIGHSTHELPVFINLLHHHSVTMVVDIRTIPRSRHNPQFNTETLPDNLRTSGIWYLHIPGLGGLRHPKPDSLNTGWRSAGFRGFADYMQTEEFEKNVEKLIQLAQKERVAVMCAEAVPWRCHRSLIADALLVQGVQVEHILGAHKHQPHKLTPFAQVNGKRIIYPGVKPRRGG